jgi:hypothetical protein
MVTTKSIFGKKIIKISGMDKKVNTLDGLPIVDAKNNLAVEVLDKDIKTSKTKSPGHCAFAIACLRAMKAKEVRVHLGRTYVRHNGKWVRYVTPVRLQKEIVAFDRGGSFEPGTYNLYAPQPTKLLGKKNGSVSPKRNGPPKKTTGYHFTGNVREGVAHY